MIIYLYLNMMPKVDTASVTRVGNNRTKYTTKAEN